MNSTHYISKYIYNYIIIIHANSCSNQQLRPFFTHGIIRAQESVIFYSIKQREKKKTLKVLLILYIFMYFAESIIGALEEARGSMRFSAKFHILVFA